MNFRGTLFIVTDFLWTQSFRQFIYITLKPSKQGIGFRCISRQSVHGTLRHYGALAMSPTKMLRNMVPTLQVQVENGET